MVIYLLRYDLVNLKLEEIMDTRYILSLLSSSVCDF